MIILEEIDHELFKRKDTDLYMDMTINLSEALTGFKKTIKMLDDRQIVIQTHPGEILKHGIIGKIIIVIIIVVVVIIIIVVVIFIR